MNTELLVTMVYTPPEDEKPKPSESPDAVPWYLQRVYELEEEVAALRKRLAYYERRER